MNNSCNSFPLQACYIIDHITGGLFCGFAHFLTIRWWFNLFFMYYMSLIFFCFSEHLYSFLLYYSFLSNYSNSDGSCVVLALSVFCSLVWPSLRLLDYTTEHWALNTLIGSMVSYEFKHGTFEGSMRRFFCYHDSNALAIAAVKSFRQREKKRNKE